MNKKVVIIGGGFGGLAVAKSLANTNFEVTLFDRTNHHLFQPLLYQVASAALSPGDIAAPIREVLSHAKNIKVLMEEVVSVATDEQIIGTKSNKQFKYDYLIMAVGARHSYFGKPEWEQFAPGLKCLDDALTIRDHMLEKFEEAEVNSEAKDLNFVVVGAGPTGVEMAGALAEISKQTLINDFRNIDSSTANIYLIEGSEQILGMYPRELSYKAQKYLEDLGVVVQLNSIVTDVQKDHIKIGDQKIQTENVIWAAGNQASNLLNQLNAPQDKMGRVIIDEFLRPQNLENVFVLGDAAHREENGSALPGLAPVAAQMGKWLGRFLKNETQVGFKYLDKGSMATIGKFKAIMKFKSFTMGGFLAWIAWCFVHILFLIDFRNRIMVFIQWALSFFFSKRGVRIINPRH